MREPKAYLLYLALLVAASTILSGGDFATRVGCTKNDGSESDISALLAIRDRISDPSQVLSSWNQSLHFCKWQGVTCGRRHRRVVMLDLASQKLSGTLDPSIGNLSFLNIIDLSDNSFTGELPPQIGSLSRLQELHVANNSFVGQISANLSRCSRLRVLALERNKFTGHVPPELGFLTNLQLFYAPNNNLTGAIPPSLGNISALEELWLDVNQLEGSIPEQLAVDLKRLTVLGVDENMLSGLVPLSVYNHSSLEQLGLSGNEFHGNLPNNLGHKHSLPNIKIFIIWGNRFSGTLPTSLSNSSSLRRIDFAFNYFTGDVRGISFAGMEKLNWLGFSGNYLGTGDVDDLSFISSLTNCSELRYLDIGGNNFGGALPNSLANLSTGLDSLLIEQNKISGYIPEGLGNLVGLEAIAMYSNHLRGVIPETVGNLNKLQQAGFGKNKLSGNIPSSVGNLTMLSWLYLEENSFTGRIPRSLGNCQMLQLLHLYGNKLTGDIPEEVIGLPSISISLNLSRNLLSGTLPLQVGNLKNLAKLDVSYNKLSGEIPDSIGDCISLDRLYMSDNSFQGTIPDSIGFLKAIEELDLSFNNLSGQLPRSLGTLKLLQKLNLSFNDLEGEVPLQGAFTNSSEVSLTGNQKLCGGIPNLHLPKCSFHKSRKPGIPLYVKVLISVIGMILALAIIISVVRIRWNKKAIKHQHSESLCVEPLISLSYAEIFRATNGFSSANLLGVGSFGSVYKGILEQNGQIVAVKVLNLQKKGAARSFMAECQALRNIRHRNLVKVITACSSIDFQGNDFKALVYEFMPNGSLDNWLHSPKVSNGDHEERRALSLSQRASIVADIAAALDYLHNQSEIPFLHCDLKPSNVLIDDNMTAHIGDFGLAKIIVEQDDGLTELQNSSTFQGTIGYAPPEYGMGSAATTHGDVYSFGILVLELLTGRRPTDEMHGDGPNLHEVAKVALSQGVLEVVDHELVLEVEKKGVTAFQCLTAILELGVACSVVSPKERIEISAVLKELEVMKDFLSRKRKRRNQEATLGSVSGE